MNVIFYGTPEFSVPTLEALINHPKVNVSCVVTQPDKPKGRGEKLQEPPIKTLAVEHDIPVLQPKRIKKRPDAFISEIAKYGPFDLGVVVAFGQIIPIEVLEYPKNGSVNIHASLLPRWRGAAPIQRALMAGDNSTGVCLMKMEAGLDTGPVYFSKDLEIEPNDNLKTLHDKLSALGANFLAEKITDICSGNISPKAQPTEGVTYAAKIEACDAEINWSYTADQINNQIRALNPFPGAFTYLEGKRMKLLQSEPVSPYREMLAPGTVSFVDKSNIEVSCGGDKALQLLELQLEGKRKMPVQEFLKGHNIKVGDSLGNLK